MANLAVVFFCLPLAASDGGLYPRGDGFCFSFYSLSKTDAVSSLAGGASAVGPFYGDQSKALEMAAALDTKCLYKVEPACMAGRRVADFERADYVWPSDSIVSNQVTAIINAVKTNARIAMWDIEPEELRSWKPQQLHYLKLVASVIRANDPQRRPVYMYECNNRMAGSLAEALAYEDLSTKGTYINDVDHGAYIHQRIWGRWSMEQELGAVARGNPAAAPWIVLWMAGDPAPADYELIPAWCRHDAYLGLVLGGKGIFVWSAARHRAGFSERSFQAYFNGYLSVAHDLNGPLQLGPVFLFGKKNRTTTMSIASGPKQLELVYQNLTNSYPPVACLSTTYEGTEYLFMVNSAEQSVGATFGGLPSVSREDLFAGGSAPTPGGSFSVILPALGVKAFRFAAETPMGKNPARQSAQVLAPRTE